MHAGSSTLISATVLFAIACTSPEKKEPEAKPSAEQPVAAKTEPEAGADAKTPEADAKTPDADAKTPEPDTTAPEPDTKAPEPDTKAPEAVTPEPEPPAEPASVPVTVITPIAATTTWREVATIDGSLQFAKLSGGVVGTTAAGYWDLSDAGELVLRSEIEAPAAEMLGVWPSDVWYVETRIKEGKGDDDRADAEIEELRLMRLRSNHRWVPQEYMGEQRFVDEGHRIKKGWRGGLLVSDGNERSYTRIAGGADDVKLTTRHGRVIDFFESKSGRLYVITQADDALWVQQDCGIEQCEPAPALKLPAGTDWDFPLQVGRQRHSISALAIATVESAQQHYVLHYETGGWKLEQLEVQPAGLWATKGGGLWTQAGSALWHRDPDGNWRNIALPEGAGAVTVAITADQTQLYIAAVVGDKSVVYATHAEAQEPPPTDAAAPPAG